MPKFFFTSKDEPCPEEVQILIKVAPIIEPELVTVVRFGYEAGIPPGITRFLEREHFEGDTVLLNHPNSKWPRRRKLPKTLMHYICELPRSGPFICPRLRKLRNPGNLYKRLWKCVKSDISARSLVTKWEREHEKELKMEEIYAYLEHLGSDFLTKAQIIAIRLTMEMWERLPPTRRSHRKRTRPEINADF